MTLPAFITAVCRDYFGHHVMRGGRKQLVDNRCDKCPLRAPCLTFGAAPARSMEELERSREVFVEAAEALGATTEGA